MYIIINERERAREIEIERERERESEREIERGERERPSTTSHLDGESLTKRQKSGKKFTRQLSHLLTPATSLSVFHGNLPQEIRRLCL